MIKYVIPAIICQRSQNVTGLKGNIMAKIAVCFPGIGYHCDKPLLYYCRNIASKSGYDNSRNISYDYNAGNIRGNDEKMKEAYETLFSQAEAELADIAWAEYDDIIFISKSIGTIIAASYAKKYGMKSVKHILYTPLAQTFLFVPENAIGFIGNADPWSRIDEITSLAAKNHVTLFTYEGCNHSLECKDVIKNIEVLKDVMQKTKDFIENFSVL